MPVTGKSTEQENAEAAEKAQTKALDEASELAFLQLQHAVTVLKRKSLSPSETPLLAAVLHAIVANMHAK